MPETETHAVARIPSSAPAAAPREHVVPSTFSAPPPRAPCSQPAPRAPPSSHHARMRVPSPPPSSTLAVQDPDVSHASSLSESSLGAAPGVAQPAPARALDERDAWDDEFDAEFGDGLDQLCEADLLQVQAIFSPANGHTGQDAVATQPFHSGASGTSPDSAGAAPPPSNSWPPPEHTDKPRNATPPQFMHALLPGTFVTAKGNSLPVPSDQALEAAKARMDAWELDDDQAAKAAGVATTYPALPSFQAKAKGHHESAANHALSPAGRMPSARYVTTSTSVSQRSVSAPNRSASSVVSAAAFATPARAVSTSFTRSYKRPAQDGLVSTPSPATRPRTSVTTSPPVPSSIGGGSASQASPAGRPLSVRAASAAKLPARRRAFKTPFKSGSRPVVTPSVCRPQGSGVRGATSVSPVHFAHPGDVSVGTPTRTMSYPVRGAIPALATPPPALFDLDPKHAPHRISLLDMRIQPESVSAATAARRGCPREAFTVLNEPSMAENFEFFVSDRATHSPEDALRLLKQLGASQLSLKWVRHHWGMVLWKLAAMTRHQPDRASHWWSWNQVLRQLRYRYEREVNVGQRSAINRIKQHDSVGSQPVVLCVYKFEYGPAPEEEATTRPNPTPQDMVLQPTLVLSDGWYTIRAQLDDTLFDAVQRGRIRAGNKLCIMGAKVRRILGLMWMALTRSDTV